MFNHIGLVSLSGKVPNWEVQIVAASLQIQISRDFTPIWGVDATVSAFDKLEDVPSGFWPIIIMDDIGFNAVGIHPDNEQKPFGLVNANNNWPLNASHEVLEILVDPIGNRTNQALSIIEGQGMVIYLMEICDPSGATQFGYQINGVWLSDFCTPEFFQTISLGDLRYSFTGAISSPRTILHGGYISWLDPGTGSWWQQIWFDGDSPQFRELGRLDLSKQSPRRAIDTITLSDRTEPCCLVGLSEKDSIIIKQKELYSVINNAKNQRAAEWQETINSIVALDKKGTL